MTDTTRAAGSEQSASEAAEARAESAVKVESPPARARKVDWLQALALSLAIASLLGPLAAAGIWDPHELRVAELARRIALNLFHGSSALSLEGVNNAMPTRGELARGELPFTSIALGFRLFGLYEWAGRLPLAVWGASGAAASYWLVRRLVDEKAAALSLIVLVTMPLYFLQARTMLGDIVTMAAFAGAFAGLGVATFDRRAGEQARLWQRVLGLGLGLSALAFGFLSRGLVLGLAAPALGVGLTWLLLRAAGTLGREPFGDYVGALSLLIGSAAAAFGVRLLGEQLSDPDRYFWLLGVSLERARTLPTFDTVLLQLGHALFPWSAVLPLAAARLLVAPTDLSDAERERWLALRTLVLVGPAVAYAGYALLAPVSGVLPFSAVAPLAIVVGLGMQSFDRERAASRAAGMVVGALSVILLSDFLEFPDKALSAFVVRDASMPESFRAASSLMLEVGTLASSALFALALSETNEPAKPAFARADYATWLQTLREQWNGNLLFGLLAVEAALLGFLGIDFLADHAPALRQYFALGGLSRSAARVGWLAIPGFVLAPPLVMAARDSLRALDRLRTRSGGFGLLPTRGVLALLALAAFGLVQSIVYYPKLAAQLSPKQTFSAYRRLARSGEELGMTGSGVGSASYYAGRNVPMFPSATEAFDWLMATTARRWLLIRESDLAILNSQYRERQKPARNLPVLDATSSEVLLISNRLEAREKNQNPFDSMFLESPPRPSHPLDANLGAELDVLGWDVSELDGRSVSRVVPGHPYRFSIFYKIVAPVSGSWETFIHIDGFQRRFNGDHPTLQGKYPLHLLRAGDFVADRYDFALDPNFTPGTYRVYFGLFSGSRRLEIKRGPSNDNRIDAGALTVE